MKLIKYLILTSIFFHLTNFANALNGTFYLKDLQGDYIEYKNTFIKAKFEIFTDQQNVIRIKPDNEHFLSANRDDLSVVARTNSEGWESFSISQILPNQYAFKTHHNTYLAKSAGYNNYSQFNITQANTPFPFILENVNNCNDEHLYYLQAENGTFLQNTIELNNSTTFSFDNNNRTKICVEERNGNQFVSLKVSNKYLSANRYDPNLVPRDEPLEWETFEVRNENNGFISLKTYHGSSVQIIANQNGNFILNHTHSLQNNSHLFSFVKAFNDENPTNIHKKAIIANNRCYYIKKNNKYIATKAHSTSFYLSNSKNDDSIFCFHNSHSHFRISSAVDASFITAASDLTVGKVNSAAGWENFHAIKLENGDYAFKTFHNNFLALNSKGELVQFDSLDINNSGFTLEDVNIIQNSTIGDYKNFGRFGNQIFQYLFMKVYALKHGLEVRTRPWDGNFFYNLNDSKPLLHLPIVSDMGWSPSDYDENLTKSYNDSSIAPFNSNDIRGYFLFHNSQHKNNKEFIRSLFKIDSNIENDFNKSLVTMRNGNKKILAIHIRRDDGVQTPLQLYVDFVNNNYDKLGKPVIYLASDGLKQVLNELNTNFPTFLTTYKVFTENDFIPSLNPDYLKGKDSGHAYFYDFYVLTKSDYLVTSVSTFSNAAAMLNETAEKNETITGIPSFYRPHTLPYKTTSGKEDYKASNMIRFNPWNIYPARPDNEDN